MKKALVLGGYGLIGSECMRALAAAGFDVVGVGRSKAAAKAMGQFQWILRDISRITRDEWAEILTDVDVVVNAAGALQSGAKDDVGAIHIAAVEQLVAAMEGTPTKIIQISAAGVSPTASTEFFRTKARGDSIVAEQSRDWVILRPVLVLSPEAYGGTALLRAISALPGMLPRVLSDAKVQTVYVADVAKAVVAAASGQIPSGTIVDLAEKDIHSFPDLCEHMRTWLGYPPAFFRPGIPTPFIRIAGKVADGLGHLGWRSPLRSTALIALSDGIQAAPDKRTFPCRSLDESLAAMPARRQDRLFARMYLALPLAIGTLAFFWLLSGLIGVFRAPAALDVLADTGLSSTSKTAFVFGGALADMALCLSKHRRPMTRAAAIGMVALSLAYLVGSAIYTPALWADPLGPMLKVLPGAMLALLVALSLEDR